MVSPSHCERTPVLYPRPLHDARRARTRLAVDPDGSLRLKDEAGSTLLARPGGVRAVALAAAGDRRAAGVPVAALPCLLLDRDDGAPLAIPLAAWMPERLVRAEPARAAEQDLLEVVGLRALLAALGRDDAWTFDVCPAGDGVLVDTGRPQILAVADSGDAQLRRVIVIGRTVGIAATVGFVAHGIVRGLIDGQWRPPLPPLPLALVILVATSLLAAILLVRRREVLPPPGAVEMVALNNGTVVGRDADGDLVLVDSNGRTGWLAGPAAGGVVTATILVNERSVPLHLVLASARGTVLAELAGSTLSPTALDSLRALLTHAGVSWHDRRSPRGAPVTQPPSGSSDPRRLQMGEACFVTGAVAALPALIALANGYVVVALTGAAVVAGSVVLARVGRG